MGESGHVWVCVAVAALLTGGVASSAHAPLLTALSVPLVPGQ